LMREYQMQLSGPWPPYHFVHRLTCGTHSHPQPSGVAVPIPATALPLVEGLPEAIAVLA